VLSNNKDRISISEINETIIANTCYALKFNKEVNMLSDNQKRIHDLARELGECLYQESEIKEFNGLGELEETVRGLTLKYVSPEIGIFLSKKVQEKVQVVKGT
jgi:hypothetical protein